MDDARLHAEAGAAEGTTCVAWRQHAGRGRAGRAWVSADGGTYVSVVVRPPPAQGGLFALAVGAAVTATIEAAGAPARLKWPNDVLMRDQKVAGVLIEASWGEAPFAIVGIGLNLTHAPLPEATSLAAVGVADAADREAWARRVAAAALTAAARVRTNPAAALIDVQARCLNLGHRVAFEHQGTLIEGVGVDINADGALIVELDDGNRVTVTAGDVGFVAKR